MKYKTTLLIWTTISIVFLVTYMNGLSHINLINSGALYVWNGEIGEWWRVITYGFLHSSFRHFILNLISGLVVMLYIENKVGSIVTLVLFLAGVTFGGIGFILFTSSIRTYTTGASAGVWAMYGAMVSMFFMFKRIDIMIIEGLFITIVVSLALWDTYTATNVNWISHYVGMGMGMLLVPIITPSKEVIKDGSLYINYVGYS